MKQKTISVTILVPVLLMLSLAMGALVLVLGISTSATTNKLSEQIVTEAVGHYASEFDTIGSSSFKVANALAPVVASMAGKEGQREVVIQLLEQVVQSNSNILALWTVWEPGAFDGQDNAYRNAPYHDSTGRFIPVAYRFNDQVEIGAVSGYDGPMGDLFYTSAREAGEPIITDPYVNSSQAEEKLLYSICIPLYIDGRFVGVLGIDTDMAEMIALMNAGSIMETGSLFTLSPGGLVATHRDPDLVLTRYEDMLPQELNLRIEDIYENGGSFLTKVYSDYSNRNVLCVAQAVKTGSTDSNWIVCGVVPFKNGGRLL